MALIVGDQNYEKIDLVEIEGKKYIKKEVSEKEKDLYESSKEFEFILKPEKLVGNVAFFEYLSEGNILNKDKKYFAKAVEEIAKFHNKGRFLKLEQTNYEIKTEIPHVEASWVTEQINKIDDRKFCLCHGDLIALNILKDGDDVKIIDWENMEIGFAESDIGRLLGDLYYVNPSFDHRYYNFTWHNELIEIYLAKRRELNNLYDIDEGRKRIYLGELWNYLGPIEMGVKNKQTETEWFRKNVEAFEITLKKYRNT